MARTKRRRKRRMSENLPALSARRGVSRRRSSAGAVAKRRGGKRRGRGLSELFTPATAMDAGRTTLSGMMGGGIAGLLNDVIPIATGFGWRLGYNLIGSFLLSGMLKAPKMGAGLAGATGLLLYQKLRQGNLQEDGGWADEEVLSEYPMFADEAGNPMMLAEDGQMYYLDEDDTVNPYEEALSQNFMNDNGEGIYPAYNFQQ